MVDREQVARDNVKRRLGQLRSRKERLESQRRSNFDETNEKFKEGHALGVSIADLARWSGSNEQHVRNVINGKNTHAARTG